MYVSELLATSFPNPDYRGEKLKRKLEKYLWKQAAIHFDLTLRVNVKPTMCIVQRLNLFFLSMNFKQRMSSKKLVNSEGRLF